MIPKALVIINVILSASKAAIKTITKDIKIANVKRTIQRSKAPSILNAASTTSKHGISTFVGNNPPNALKTGKNITSSNPKTEIMIKLILIFLDIFQ